MKKEIRLFEILDAMNIQDAENKTSYLSVCNSFLSADYSAKQGGTKVTIGVPGNVTFDLLEQNTIPILLIIDRSEYEKIKVKLEEG